MGLAVLRSILPAPRPAARRILTLVNGWLMNHGRHMLCRGGAVRPKAA
ncbi:uncharacterized protein CMC5_051720 [Chondromyces crocatus]|uniref:Uncharacterized protein n=1 Tax=Chondromyces crocatus TaxID=52 RepID=A0A0K1EJH6_CHOCO|nr:uncharacterized protein CMC5_051720 [Chondromyces crocatus]